MRIDYSQVNQTGLAAHGTAGLLEDLFMGGDFSPEGLTVHSTLGLSDQPQMPLQPAGTEKSGEPDGDLDFRHCSSYQQEPLTQLRTGTR